MTIGAVGGAACDLMAAAVGVRGIGGKLVRGLVGYLESTKFIPNTSYCCSMATIV